MAEGFRILGSITKRLFPTGKETPQEIPRTVVKKPKREANKTTDYQVGKGAGRKKK